MIKRRLVGMLVGLAAVATTVIGIRVVHPWQKPENLEQPVQNFLNGQTNRLDGFDSRL